MISNTNINSLKSQHDLSLKVLNALTETGLAELPEETVDHMKIEQQYSIYLGDYLDLENILNSKINLKYAVIECIEGAGAFGLVLQINTYDWRQNYVIKIILDEEDTIPRINPEVNIYQELNKSKDIKNHVIEMVEHGRTKTKSELFKLLQFGGYDSPLRSWCTYIVLEAGICSLQDIVNYHGKALWITSHVLYIVKSIVKAMLELKKLNIVHHDIKPDNVIIMHEDKIKLADFGLSIKVDQKFIQKPGELGTPGYMAPELLKESYDKCNIYDPHLSDAYSLGKLMTKLPLLPGNMIDIVEIWEILLLIEDPAQRLSLESILEVINEMPIIPETANGTLFGKLINSARQDKLEKKADKKGDPFAAFSLGKSSEIDLDLNTAEKYFLKIINQIPSARLRYASLISQGNIDVDVNLYKSKESLLQVERMIGNSKHPVTSELYLALGDAYESAGEYPKAREFYQKSLEIKEATLSKLHPEIATCYNNIGLIEYRLGNYEKAMEHHIKALEMRVSTLGDSHQAVATSYDNLASVYHVKGDYEKALEFYTLSLNFSLANLGPEDLETAGTYNNIGQVYMSKKEYEKALVYHSMALEITEKELGEIHPQTAIIYNNLGLVHENLGDLVKAEEYYKKTLKIEEKCHGVDHLNTATILNNLGSLEEKKQNYDEALEYFTDRLILQTRVWEISI